MPHSHGNSPELEYESSPLSHYFSENISVSVETQRTTFGAPLAPACGLLSFLLPVLDA